MTDKERSDAQHSGSAARQEALRALDWVLRDRRMLAHFTLTAGLPPAEAARAQRLAATVLRHLQPIDAVLKGLMDRKPPWAPKQVLRLAATEMLVDGAAAHGVIDSAVALMKARRQTGRFAGFVNAVLRRVAEDGPARFAAAPPHRLPGWIGGELNKRHGFDTVRAIEAAHAAGAPIDLTPRSPGAAVPGTRSLPTGSLRMADGGQVSALAGYETGAFWVQDAAAALPVRLMGDMRGRRVIDLCAAPGGKTMQLAALGAQVTALDLSERRMARVAENLARTGLEATCVVGDVFDHSGSYDGVLLDAPCSATGTIRRHPDLPFVKTAAETEALTRLQMRMLDHALGLLAPGGRLVFCTCSLLPVEGEFQVRAALKRHPGLRVVPTDPTALGGDAGWASPEGGLRLRPDFWPDLGGIDGFYMAALEVA